MPSSRVAIPTPSGISAPTSKATYPSSVFSFRMRKASQSSMNKASKEASSAFMTPDCSKAGCPTGRAATACARYGERQVEIEDPYRFPPILSDFDLYLLGEGTHTHLYEKLGAHPMVLDEVSGVAFAVFTPNAQRVSVVGDFNSWDGRRHPMRVRGNGFWEIFMPEAKPGSKYKYEIIGADGRMLPLKSDPLAFAAELRPQTASIVVDLHAIPSPQPAPLHVNALDAPISIYEVHLGSWRRRPQESGRWLSYRELAEELPAYAHDLGFTHIEFLPVSEHPFDGSWGYQPTGLFAPTSRFGTPTDFAGLVDACHRAGLAVILDWVPGHFPDDPHGLSQFDGTAVYEHANPMQGRHLDWNTLVYNYARTEVANFLLANGLFWPDRYRIDGLRVDAVASMLYLDYSRSEGSWIPNKYGGRENLEAISLLRRFNTEVFSRFPNATTVAEESTAWPMVSKPVDWGGLGFGYKWNMGWMHDTLEYIGRDPIYRKHHHGQILFGLHYAFSENFILPLSPMTRSCTASAPSSAACRATNGSALQICAPITVSCSAIPARSFCSWAESSARKTNGGTTTRSIGISLSGHGMQAFRL